jgi:hypothetical protein
VDVQGRLPQRRHSTSASRRTRRAANWTAGRSVYRSALACQPPASARRSRRSVVQRRGHEPRDRLHLARARSHESARQLFLFSITYLPLLLGALVADRLWL